MILLKIRIGIDFYLSLKKLILIKKSKLYAKNKNIHRFLPLNCQEKRIYKWNQENIFWLKKIKRGLKNQKN
jgi:hypothetical protein